MIGRIGQIYAVVLALMGLLGVALGLIGLFLSGAGCW